MSEDIGITSEINVVSEHSRHWTTLNMQIILGLFSIQFYKMVNIVFLLISMWKA